MKKLVSIILILLLSSVCDATVKVFGDGETVLWYNNSQTFSIAASGSMSASDDYIWPVADGSANYVFHTNGSGVLRWATVDISDSTNFAVTSPITLTGDTVGWDSTLIDATTWSDGSNASNIWTFDVSGTDHTMMASDGLMTFDSNVTVTGEIIADRGLFGGTTSPLNPGSTAVGRWRLDDNLGTTAVIDDVGSNNGVLDDANTNTVSITGKLGLGFDLTSDRVEWASNIPELDFTNQCSVVLWFRTSTNYSANAIANCNTSGNDKWTIVFRNDSGSIAWWVNNAYFAQGADQGDGYWADNAWHLVVATYDRSLGSERLKLYVDNVKIATANGADVDMLNPMTSIILGNIVVDIDNFMLYNEALSEGEISALWNSSAGNENANFAAITEATIVGSTDIFTFYHASDIGKDFGVEGDAEIHGSIYGGGIFATSFGNYVGFDAPTLSTDTSWTLPDDDGAANQVMKTNGSEVLGWTGHDGLADFEPNEHIDWTSTSENFSTSGTLSAGAITGTSFVIGGNTLDTNEWAVLDGVTANQVIDWTNASANFLTTGEATVDDLIVSSFVKSNLIPDTDNTYLLGRTAPVMRRFTALSLSQQADVNTMTLESGLISDTTGAIGFDDENISTSGTWDAGITTVGKATGVANIYRVMDGSTTALIACNTDTTPYNVTFQASLVSEDTDGAIYAGAASSGVLRFGGTSGSNNEALTLDFETTANKVIFGTPTGVTELDWGAFNFSNIGTLAAGVATLASGSTIGNLTFADGSITDSGGTIDFGDEDFTTTGNVGIGAAAQSTIGLYVFKNTGTNAWRGFATNIEARGSANVVYGYLGQLFLLGSGSHTGARTAMRPALDVWQTAGTINNAKVIDAAITWRNNAAADGTITNAYLYDGLLEPHYGTTTNLYTFYGRNPSDTFAGSGSIGTHYMLYLEEPNRATTNWAIYSAGGQSVHAGNLKIGSVTADIDSLFEVDGALGLAIATVTGNTTLNTSHSTVLVNASGNVTITLPTAASAYNNTDGIGRIYEVKKIDADADTVTIDPDGSEEIEFADTAVITDQGETITFQSNGTAWFIL